MIKVLLADDQSLVRSGFRVSVVEQKAPAVIGIIGRK